MSQEATETVREPVFEFDYFKDPLLQTDPHGAYWKLKETAPPVFWTPAHGGHWVVTTANAAIEVLRHPDRFSSKYLSIPPNPNQPKMIPESLDPPEHRPYRQLLRPYFESNAIEPLEPRIREWADQLIDAVAESGQCEFIDQLGSRFPVSVFMELFGFPLDQFDFFRGTVVEYFNAQIDETRRTELSMQIIGTLAQLFEERRADPKDDLASKLVQVDFEGRKLEQDELISIGFLMFLAGLDTVVNALAFGMRHLAEDDALQSKIIAEPKLIPRMVDELMRRYTFVSTPRYITEDTEIDGTTVYAGDSVLVPLHMVGWDDNLTDCPAEVQLDRPHCRHAGFGSGIHTCLGIHLARLEMVVFYETWVKKVGRFQLAPKQELRFRGGSVQALEAMKLQWETNQ